MEGDVRIGLRRALSAAALAALFAIALALSNATPGEAARTTLDRSIKFNGSLGTFRKLVPGPGLRRVLRQDGVGKAKKRRKARRRSMAYFAQLTDPQIVVDLCGQAYMGWEIGQLWKSYQYVYTEQTQGLGGPVDYLYCVEAIDKQDERGRTPKVPDTGECLNDDQGFWTVECSSTEALYEVLNTESYDPPAAMTETEVQAALGGCAESSSFYPYGLYGADDLVYGAMCIDYTS